LSRLLAPFIPFMTDEIYRNLTLRTRAASEPSVHLTAFPQSDPNAIDETLSADMAVVLEVVGLGRAARSEANVKVRQPLPALLVYARDPRTIEALNRLQDQVKDELNIKAIEPLTELGEVVTYDIRPNLSILGPKYGKRLGAIRQGLAGLDPVQVATTVSANQNVGLDLGDQGTVELLPSEILVDLKKRAGFAAAQGSNATVVLDTTLTPELVAEGLARDFVRGVQDARKNAGYQIEDTIAIAYETAAAVADAIDAHLAYVTSETLATSVESLDASPNAHQSKDGWHRDTVTVGKDAVAIALRRSNGI
jgi:isoleucyl-tRNA synthetase